MEATCCIFCNEDDGRVSVKTVCKIVETVRRSKSECLMTRGERRINAGSVLFLMSLGLKDGDIVTLKSDNEECVWTIMDILYDRDKLPVIAEELEREKMKFKVEDNYAGCLQIYNSLSDQEKKWFGTYDSGGEVIIHRKLVKVDNEPAGFVEVGDCAKIPNGIEGDCIVYIAVAPEYRRRGIGFKLVSEVVRSFKENGFKALTYRVNKNNTASIGLAEKCGLERLPPNLIDKSIRETEYVYIGE